MGSASSAQLVAGMRADAIQSGTSHQSPATAMATKFRQTITKRFTSSVINVDDSGDENENCAADDDVHMDDVMLLTGPRICRRFDTTEEEERPESSGSVPFLVCLCVCKTRACACDRATVPVIDIACLMR